MRVCRSKREKKTYTLMFSIFSKIIIIPLSNSNDNNNYYYCCSDVRFRLFACNEEPRCHRNFGHHRSVKVESGVDVGTIKILLLYMTCSTFTFFSDVSTLIVLNFKPFRRRRTLKMLKFRRGTLDGIVNTYCIQWIIMFLCPWDFRVRFVFCGIYGPYIISVRPSETKRAERVYLSSLVAARNNSGSEPNLRLVRHICFFYYHIAFVEKKKMWQKGVAATTQKKKKNERHILIFL